MRFPVAILVVLIVAFVTLAPATAEEEGTRHIVGDGVDLYFMNEMVFGTVDGSPLWAIYNCGSDIQGKIDVAGKYRPFEFRYQKEDPKIVGSFGRHGVAVDEIETRENGFVYHVVAGADEHLFSIRYEELEGGHMLNSVIEGTRPDGRAVTLKVDGHLCPFATSGVILIAAGTALGD